MATTLETIEAKMKKLQAQADALMTKETAKVLKTIRELMEKHSLTAADMTGMLAARSAQTTSERRLSAKRVLLR